MATLGFMDLTSVSQSLRTARMWPRHMQVFFWNAINLSSRSQMWWHIIKELGRDEALGPALPYCLSLAPKNS
ncbi:hypothetical protein BD769DRAFT_1674027 [Suillus cothurnatus]|nr:hypothetical protein BD769DRAFT_1674027 [Suillus cothurnatus]